MGTWRCGYCDSYNPDTVDRCITCGRSRAGDDESVDGRPREETVACLACGGANPPDRARCQWCGAVLPAVARPIAPAAPVARAVGDAPADEVRFPEDLLEDDAEPTIQTQPARPKMRPCARCGISLEPGEWVLVAGPRILCRACFHEEFGTRRRSEDVDDSPEGGRSWPAQRVVSASQAPPPQRSGQAGPGRAVFWYGVSAMGLVCGGALLTWVAGWTWGATPLLAAGLLAALAWRASRMPGTAGRDA